MNRREFLEFLGLATVGGAVAYSFPEIIVPKNIEIPSLVMRITDSPEYGFGFSGFVESTPLGSYNWFYEAYIRAKQSGPEPNYLIVGGPFVKSYYFVPENTIGFVEADRVVGIITNLKT